MNNDGLPKFKYEIGEMLKDEKRNLVITDKEYRKEKRGESNVNAKYYKYKCNKCGFNCEEHYVKGEYRKELWIEEHNLKKGTGCSCCYNRVAVLGINTVFDTDSWVCVLGIDKDKTKRYTRGSHEKVEVICPDCGNKKKMSINKILERKSISCVCGDSTSYAEKFIINILNQLKVEFIKEAGKTTFNWCGDYRYDFYLPKHNMIIEVHGEQHYRHTGRGRSLEEEQENDRFKKELALNNSIRHYIVIDCRKSEFDWIASNIHKSLKNHFDMTKVDFTQAEEFALSNLTRQICNRWNNKEEWETTVDIGKEFNLSSNAIVKHLRKGNRYNWCNYDGKEEMRKCAVKMQESNKKRIKMFREDEFLGEFASATDLERISEEKFGVKLFQANISAVCRGKLKHYKGYVFKYI